MMSQIGESIGTTEPFEDVSPPLLLDRSVEAQLLNANEIPRLQGVSAPSQPEAIQLNGSTNAPMLSLSVYSSADAKRAPALIAADLNPPEIQSCCRTHSQEARAHTCGKIPRPSSEADYDTWRSHLELIMKDPALCDLQRSRKIIESLLGPAADIVKGLSPEAPPTANYQLLDSAFDTVGDGEELFAQFMNTLQDAGEKPSAYLQCLQVALNLAARRGGIAAEEMDKHIFSSSFAEGVGITPCSLISNSNKSTVTLHHFQSLC